MTLRERLRSWRPYGLDGALATLAVAFGWCTLFYPFGRDQGLYYYVGREWALRGSVPYRDILDHKTPGIYLVHGALVALFGQQLWAIRVAELLAVVALGIVAAHASQPRERRVPPGLAGFAACVTSFLYFGSYDFRETGEGEVWLVLFSMFAAAAVRRSRTLERAAFLGGLGCAAALLMKPSAVWLVLIVHVLLALRVREEPTRTLRMWLQIGLRFAAGAALVLVPVFGYLGAVGALADFVDIVGRANAFYVTHESGVKSVSHLLGITAWWMRWTAPLPWIALALTLVSFVYASVRRERPMQARHALAIAFLLGTYASVVMQAKFYLGHLAVVAPAFAMALTASAADCCDWLEARYPSQRVAAPIAMVIAALLAFGAYTTGPEPVTRYAIIHRTTWDWLHGRATREAHLSLFFEHGYGAQALHNYQVGVWLRQHSDSNDFVAVRGFQPQIYAWANRRAPGRFFWTTFLVNPARAYKRAEWLAEDRAALSKNPPRYVVALAIKVERPEDLTTDMVEWWTRFGYLERERIGDFVILERVPGTETETL